MTQQASFDHYQYTDEDIKEALETVEKVQVGLNSSLSAADDGYHRYVFYPFFELEKLLYPEGQQIFLREHLNYILNQTDRSGQCHIQPKRVAFPLNLSQMRHWMTLGINCSDPDMEQLNQLINRLKVIDQEDSKEASFPLNNVEAYLKDKEVLQCLSGIYQAVEVNCFDTLNQRIATNQSIIDLIQNAVNCAHKNAGKVKVNQVFEQGPNDCGVAVVKIASAYIQNRSIGFSSDENPKNALKDLRKKHQNACSGIKKRQMADAATEKPNEQQAPFNMVVDKQGEDGHIKGNMVRTSQLVRETQEEFSSIMGDLDQLHKDYSNVYQNTKNRALPESEKQQLLKDIRGLYQYYRDFVIYIYEKNLEGASDKAKLNELSQQYKYFANRDHWWTLLRNGALAMLIGISGFADVSETSINGYCASQQKRECQDITVFSSQGLRLACLFLFGLPALAFGKASEYYKFKSRLTKAAIDKIENNKTYTQMFSEISQSNEKNPNKIGTNGALNYLTFFNGHNKQNQKALDTSYYKKV